tara:strand:- start:106 stop:1245 length:1140 start_codon:yes stop_codon:yes gene_type:complete
MKKILVFTGSRADYSLLRNLVKRISNKKTYKLDIAASSIHFMRDFGRTIKEVKKDKFNIRFQGKTKLKKNDFKSVINYCGNSMIEFSKFLQKSKPNIVILLGDRYEVFSFCTSAFFLNIPIIHIHGGELTYGAFDDTLRHCITKMSNFHFVCHDIYKNRVKQLGENSNNIFNVGAPGLENIQSKKFTKKKILLEKLNIPEKKRIAVVTFHPETRTKTNPKKQIDTFLKALFSVKDIFYIFTYSNTDPFGKYFIKKINKYKKYKNIRIFKTMGADLYHDVIKVSDLVIGNSSSGIFEAPSLKTPTLNIGRRQEGRIMGPSIFNCENRVMAIRQNILKILNKDNINFKNVFYKKDTSLKILNKINKILKLKRFSKKFYDIK